MKRRQWLKNDFNPALVRSYNFTVEESPVQLVATGLGSGERVPIEVRADADTTLTPGVDHHWAPLYRNGVPYELRGDNNQIVLLIPGTYRIAPAAAYAGSVTIALWEDETPWGERVHYADSPAPPAPIPLPPPCSSTPLPDVDTILVHRCDGTTKLPVTLVYQAEKPNNDVCPPTPAGTPSLLGHILADGSFVAGAYAGTLGSCGCPERTPVGEVGTWG